LEFVFVLGHKGWRVIYRLLVDSEVVVGLSSSLSLMDDLKRGIFRDKWPGSWFSSEEGVLGDKRCMVEWRWKLYLLNTGLDILTESKGEAGIERRGDGSPQAGRGRSETYS
jgi:hypothetical protein